ncbi:MAG TPA: hypothetical protein VMU71_04880 [Terracidiphilus sp.]|nr:hypothetical protein [Terracidiphilus sp.]
MIAGWLVFEGREALITAGQETGGTISAAGEKRGLEADSLPGMTERKTRTNAKTKNNRTPGDTASHPWSLTRRQKERNNRTSGGVAAAKADSLPGMRERNAGTKQRQKRERVAMSGGESRLTAKRA